MITRRRLLEAAGTGAVLAVAGRVLSRTFVTQAFVTEAFVTEADAQAAGLSLHAQLPEGTREEAGIEALEIVVAGTDRGAVHKTRAFIKSIPVQKAIEDTTIVAYEMNGRPLPHWTAFPARVVVPGWTATYWMKHVSRINVVTKPFDGFWMKSAYRIPLGKFPIVARFASQETAVNTPITEMVVNSLVTSHADGATVKAGGNVAIGGLAWDAGYGIHAGEISTDGGSNWTAAALGEDIGPFALRTFSHALAMP